MNTETPIEAQRSQTLGNEVFDRILELIYSCELEPGTVVNELALAARFGVSRGPVREAIQRLQGIQLVSREPYMKARVVSLSREAVVDLFQMREALEGYACRLATKLMGDGDLDGLITVLEKEHDEHAVQRFDFHRHIAQASGNQRIIEALCGDLYHLLRIYRRMSGAVPERKEQAFGEHWQITRAMRARDAMLAELLMRSHIERAAQHLIQQIPTARD